MTEYSQVEFPDGSVIEVELLGTHPRHGVKFRPINADPPAHLYCPPSWLVGYRPADHPEWNQSVRPELAQFRMTENQRAVLGALAAAGDIGMVDDDHEIINKLRADSAGKRRLELQRKGYVEAAGKTRRTRRGSSAVVYRITQPGREALIQHDNALVAV